MKVGVLALQGDVPEHRRSLAALLPPESIALVRQPADLEGLSAILIPGGESTVIAQLLQSSGLWEPLRRRLEAGLPVLATCAGLILVSQRVEASPGGHDPPTFGLLDVMVRRNDFGAQVDSFEGPVDLDGERGDPFPGVFIRAPRISSFGRGVHPYAKLHGEVVGVRSRGVWGLTFHPELSSDPRILAAFLAEVRTGSAHKNRSAKVSATKSTAATPAVSQ
jgi:5'-phosphate synthase pdxT subunit